MGTNGNLFGLTRVNKSGILCDVSAVNRLTLTNVKSCLFIREEEKQQQQ
jgi:hypothetical protein